jgi:hypothetical protein
LDNADSGGFDPADIDAEDTARGRDMRKRTPFISVRDGTYTTDLRECAETELSRRISERTETDDVQRVVEAGRTKAQELATFLAIFDRANGKPPRVAVSEIALAMEWSDSNWDDRLDLLMESAREFIATEAMAISFQRTGSYVRAVPLSKIAAARIGRRVTTTAMAKFAQRQLVQDPRKTWKQIAKMWNRLHPDEIVSRENLRAALRRHEKRKMRTKRG